VRKVISSINVVPVSLCLSTINSYHFC